MVRPCQRMSTSMSAEQASSGAIPWTSTVSPFRSGETTLAAMHLAIVCHQMASALLRAGYAMKTLACNTYESRIDLSVNGTKRKHMRYLNRAPQH
jgi:hypothetical protein